MDQPDKTTADDLKRMLRRLERIEAQKAERTQARGKSAGARDMASPPPAQRRSSIITSEVPDDPGQALPPRLPVPPTPAAPELSSVITSADEPRPAHQRGSAPVATIAAAMLCTLTAVAVTFWLMGGLDHASMNFGAGNTSADHSVSSDNHASATPGSTAAPGDHTNFGTSVAGNTASNSDVAPPAPQGPESSSNVSASTTSETVVPAAPEAAPETELADLAPSPSELETSAPDTQEAAVESSQSDVVVEATPEDATAPALTPPVEADAAETAVGINSDQETIPDAPDATSEAESKAADSSGPESPVAALQSPSEATTPDASMSEPLVPASVRLLSSEHVTAEPGVPLLLPVSIEANSSQLTGYYVVISGLTRGSSFSSGIALLFDTWQIAAKSLPDLKLTASSGFARRMKLKVELRGPQGDTVTRTALIVELPGLARNEAGLKEFDASGVAPPPEGAQELIDRAEVFLDNGSLQAARMLLERAAANGAGEAAMMLAASYDPQYASRFSADHPGADVALAKRWYKRASELGVTIAASRLNAM